MLTIVGQKEPMTYILKDVYEGVIFAEKARPNTVYIKLTHGSFYNLTHRALQELPPGTEVIVYPNAVLTLNQPKGLSGDEL